MRILFIFLCVLLITVNTRAQVFGGNPPSLKWKQVNTGAVRIIFPDGLDSQASRAASVIDYLAAHKPVSLGNKQKKISLVMQNQTTISNAYVGLGPYRSEFFMTPPASNFEEGSIAWGDMLALHEYRHVMQFNNFNTGLSSLVYTLFGDDGLSVAINASVPDWFFEGDAVYNETALSNQGRGRLPLFVNAYPSLWQAGKKYSWMKLRNGSLKDYVPNHYYLGYLLVNYGREKYGADFWTKVTQDAASFKGLFYPFQAAVKKYAGVDYKTFREQALESVKNKLAVAAAEKNNANPVFPVNTHYVTSRYFPYQAGTDSLIYLKASYRQRPAFYLKDAAGEHRIKTRDISIDEQFSYRNGKIVYTAFESGARWGWQDYGVIKLLDIKTGEQRTLTRKTKYFTPDISADGSRVAAVQNSSNGKSEIHVLNAATGEVITAIRSGEIRQFTDPKFIDDNTLVTAVRLVDGKMALALANISTGITSRLTTPSYNVAGYPCVYNGMVYFTASYGGNDDVFAVRLSDKKIFRVTSGSTGNYFVNAGAGKITWSAFTAEGYQLQQADEKNITLQEMPETAVETLVEKLPVAIPEGTGDALRQKVIFKKYDVTKYRKGTGLLHVHSWRPYYEDPIFTYSLYGENILNTLQTELYYQYNQDDRTSSTGLNLVYGAWLPYLSAGTQYTFNREAQSGNRLRQWDQLDSRIGLNIPLNITSGQTYKNFNIGTNYFLRNDFNKGFFKDSLGNTSFTYLHHYLTWSAVVDQARQHIYPRLGYAVSLAERYAVTRYKGNQFVANASVYLPGFLSNHSLVVNASFQERDTLSQVVFSNRFAYSRGYTGRYFSRMWKLGVNYHFPLMHPDWGFGNILYISRIRANAFYDFTKVYSRDKTQTANQRSAGGEIYFDTRWWNQYPLTFGFRVSRLLDNDQYDGFKGTLFEFIMPVNIIPR